MTPCVLLVDDELHILKAAEFKLKKQGWEVLTASDGEEAWETIQARRPDLMVTDYQMPRLSGLELIARLRATEEYADLPVILLTARGYERPVLDIANGLRVLEVLAKPFSPRELFKRVESALLATAHRAPAIPGSSLQ
jgi:two-component system alkaline phosphatase synthesis response regulator PhoP